MTPLVVGVTSHRDLAVREIDMIRQRVRAFFASLARDFPTLPLVVLSALAEGGDQLVAREALDAGALLVATLPLPRELYVEDFTDPRWRNGFDTLCEQAVVASLPLREGQSRLNVESSGMARDCQYAQAGVYIASHCHILLALWDGKDSERLGGTAQIVKYYLTGAMPGLIDRRHSNRHVLGVGDERLLYHIACSREGGEGTTAPGLQPLQTMWRSATTMSAGASGMPEAFRPMFAHMAQFNADCDLHADALAAAMGAPHGTGHVDDADLHAPAGIDRRFHAADWLAVHYRKRVLLAMRLIYTLAALMGIAFTWYAHLPGDDLLIYLFLLLFAAGALVAVLARRRDWHRKYLDYRALAEGLRIQAYWRRAGISMTRDQEFVHDDFLQKQNVELGWIRNVMRAAGLPLTGASVLEQEPAALERVIAEWVGQSGRSGQLDYYERKSAECASLHHVTETVGAISLWGGISISVFLAAFALRLSHDTKTTLVMVMAVLSIIAAVREAYAYRKADKMLIKQYRFMQRIFASARAALDTTHDPAEQRAILRALGHAALTEHAQWTLMQRERQVEQGKL